jgi:hypothetical protein
VNGESENAETILSGQIDKTITQGNTSAKGETTEHSLTINAGRSAGITIAVWSKPRKAGKKFVKLPCEHIESAFKTKDQD